MNNPDIHHYLTSEDGLATRLKNARGAMPAKDLAAQTGWLPSKVSKIESGKQLPSKEDLDKWAELTGIDDELLGQLQAMLVEAKTLRVDYTQRMRAGQTAVQREYGDLAEVTQSFRFFETSYVPRYLQIRDYTRAVLLEHKQFSSVDDVEEATTERQKSVGYLTSDRQFELLINEPVLRYRAFPPEVMRAQLFHLAAAIGLRNVRFGIYPSLSRRVGRTPQNTFELFDDIGYVETWIKDGPKLLIDDVRQYDETLAKLWPDAAEGDEARELIYKAIADLPTE